MSISSRITEMEQHIGNAYDKIEDLGIDLTNVDKNIDNISSMLEDVWNEYPKVTATDVEEATINGTKKGRMEIDLKGQTSQGVLPTEYQQVEYIENTGSSYIDTGIILTQNNSFEFKMKSPELIVSDTSMNCGSRSGASSNNISSNFQLNNLAVDFNNSNYSNYRATYSYMQPSTIYKVYSSKLVRKISDENDNVLASNTNVCNDTIRTPNTCTIFKINPAPQIYWLYARTKLYYFKIWENDELVINLVPCYRKADNEIGMYDTITNTFFTNQGTDIFVKGNDVPNPDFPQEIKNVIGNANEKIQNKNLLSFPTNTKTNKGVQLSWSGTHIQLVGTATSNYPIDLNTAIINLNNPIPSGTYMFSVMGTYEGTATKNISWVFVDEDGTTYSANDVGENNPTKVLTFNKKIVTLKFLRNMLEGASIDFDLYLQLEQGSTATPYVPHQEQNYPFTFESGQRAMQGTTLEDDGIHNSRTQEVLTNNVINKIISPSSPLGFYFTVSITKMAKYQSPIIAGNLLSNRFKKVENSIASIDKGCITLSSTRNKIALCVDETIDSVEKLEQWLLSNETIVEYDLLEEEIIPYNSTQQTQYNAIKQARSYDDITYITSTSDELGFKMDVESLSNGVSNSSNTRTLALGSLNQGSLNNIKEVDTEDTEVAQDAEVETSVESEE